MMIYGNTSNGANKHQLAVDALATRESQVAVKEAIRFIKNAIIGNPTKKEMYLTSLALAPRFVLTLIKAVVFFSLHPNQMLLLLDPVEWLSS